MTIAYEVGEYATLSDLPDYDAEAAGLVRRQFLPGLERYACHHIAPGSFLRAMLEKDLDICICHAHPGLTVQELKDLYTFIFTCFPSPIWGSPEAVQAWLMRGNEHNEKEQKIVG